MTLCLIKRFENSWRTAILTAVTDSVRRRVASRFASSPGKDQMRSSKAQCNPRQVLPTYRPAPRAPNAPRPIKWNLVATIAMSGELPRFRLPDPLLKEEGALGPFVRFRMRALRTEEDIWR